MPAQNIHVIAEDFKNLQEVSEAFAILQKQFRYMQEHIDVENIIAKSLTADVIKAGAITAEEMTVEELSAITANMGKLTSGQIYGAYIATAEGTYPRAEMSSEGDLFAAYTTETSKAVFKPDSINSSSGAPALTMTQGSAEMAIGHAVASLLGMGIKANSDFEIQASGGIFMSGIVNFLDWGAIKILHPSTQTLQEELNLKANVSEAGYNLVFSNTSRLLKMFNKDGDLLAQVTIPVG